VCEQDVIMGVLKNSLQTLHRKAESTCSSLSSGVFCQSVESVISSSFDSFGAIIRFWEVVLLCRVMNPRRCCRVLEVA
jgi:hypothetical protein